MNLLSIIIPVYNSEQTLNKCLDSILNSCSDFNFEIILINDGSTDGSINILNTYKSRYPDTVFVYSQKNKGVSSARNRGIINSTGKYITFVDSDDYVENDYIKEVFYLLNSTDADLYIFDAFQMIQNKNNKTRTFKNPQLKNKDLKVLYTEFFSVKLNAPWDKIFKAEIIKKHQIKFLEDINLAEDIIFQLHYLSKIKTYYYLDKALYNYSINTTGLSNISKKKEALIAYNLLFNKFMEINRKVKYYDLNKILFNTELQIITNYVGKLYKNGLSSKEIFDLVSNYNWYEDLVNHKYEKIRNKIRRFLLQRKMFFIISIFFNK